MPRAVGTNTLRSTRSSLPFLVRARQALGHKIEVISSGRSTAHLPGRGPRPRRRRTTSGGRHRWWPTELIVETAPRTLDSREMGCVSWTLRYFPDGQRPGRICASGSRGSTRARGVAVSDAGFGLDLGRGCLLAVKAVDKVVHAMLGHPHITPAGLAKVVDAHCRRTVSDLRLPGLTEVRRPVLWGDWPCCLPSSRAWVSSR